jgi:hypothetical protein
MDRRWLKLYFLAPHTHEAMPVVFDGDLAGTKEGAEPTRFASVFDLAQALCQFVPETGSVAVQIAAVTEPEDWKVAYEEALAEVRRLQLRLKLFEDGVSDEARHAIWEAIHAIEKGDAPW